MGLLWGLRELTCKVLRRVSGTGSAVDVCVIVLLGRVASYSKFGQMLTICLGGWRIFVSARIYCLTYFFLMWWGSTKEYNIHAHVNVCGCVWMHTTWVESWRNWESDTWERCNRRSVWLIGAQPLGSQAPGLNLGAATTSMTLRRCLNLSELQSCS